MAIHGARSTWSARWRDESGLALIIALMSLILMTALGMALMLTTSTETMISSNFTNAEEALYSADAGIERSMDDLLTVPDWNTILSGVTTSAFIDGSATGTRKMPGGGTIDLSQVLSMANCNKLTACAVTDMNTITPDRPWGQNNPRWQLYAYGNMNDIVPTGTVNSPYYVVVMVADDASEDDDDPLKDSNGALAMRAEAFGPNGSHKVIEVTVARTDSSMLERGYIGQRGQDEQNRRARKSAVGTPGKSMQNTGISLGNGM